MASLVDPKSPKVPNKVAKVKVRARMSSVGIVKRRATQRPNVGRNKQMTNRKQAREMAVSPARLMRRAPLRKNPSPC